VNFPFSNWNTDIIRPEIAPMIGKSSSWLWRQNCDVEIFSDIFEEHILEINREKQTK
jgi:hypothetical protein